MARVVHALPVDQVPENYDVPTWKFVVALVVVLVSVFLGTLLWMWRDTKPRRHPAILAAPQSRTTPTNAPAAKP